MRSLVALLLVLALCESSLFEKNNPEDQYQELEALPEDNRGARALHRDAQHAVRMVTVEAEDQEMVTDKKWDITDVHDDSMDKNGGPEAQDNSQKTSIGKWLVSRSTKEVYKKNRGMNGRHRKYNPNMGRKYVRAPGYTSKDARTDSRGRYFIGTGRRRIGAGFGRRRAPVEIKENKHKKPKARILNIAKAMKRSTSGFKKYFGGINKCRKTRFGKVCNGRGNAMKKVSHSTMLRLARQLAGQKSGPSFYSHCNYLGHKSNHRKSVAKNTRNLASIKVPAGWCVKLFTKPNFQGQSHEICGKKDHWCLSQIPLKLKFPIVLGEKGAKGVDGVVTQYETKDSSWKDMAMSMLVTKYRYVVHKPTQKCNFKCGTRGYYIHGKVTCQRSKGRKKKATVSNKKCFSVYLMPPRLPDKRCPTTPPCVRYVTRKPTVAKYGQKAKKCTNRCGTPKHNIFGSVHCQETGVGFGGESLRLVPGMNCKFWRLKKPRRPTKVCKTTPKCVKWHATPAKCNNKCKKYRAYGDVLCKYTRSSSRTADSMCQAQPNPSLNKPGKRSQACPVPKVERDCKEKAAKERAQKARERYNKERNSKAAERNAKESTYKANHLRPGQCCWFLHGCSSCCNRCPGGNHWVWPHQCGTSRRCN